MAGKRAKNTRIASNNQITVFCTSHFLSSFRFIKRLKKIIPQNGSMKIEGDLVSNPNPDSIPEKITYLEDLLVQP
jgi:hypothetical protein